MTDELAAIAQAAADRAPIVPADVLAEATADVAPAPTSPVATAAQSAAPIDYQAEARELIEFAHALCVPVWPSLDRVYPEKTRERIIAAAVPLMEKYKFTLGKIGPELTFAIVTVPLVIPTVQAIRHDNKKAKEAAAELAGTRAPAPAGAELGTVNDQGASNPLGDFPGLDPRR